MRPVFINDPPHSREEVMAERMAKRKVSIELSWPLQCYLRELKDTGLYGRSIEEAALTLILDGLKHSVSTKMLQLKTFD